MKIYHFCQYKVRHSNGVQSAVWELAKAQAKLGAEVEIVSLGRAPSEEEVQYTRGFGVGLRGVPGQIPRVGPIRQIVRELKAQQNVVCHLHSVFVVWQTVLATVFRWSSIPYFMSAHGNLSPRELKRKPLRKRLFLRLVEIGCLSGAAGFLCASRFEADYMQELVPRPRPIMIAANGMDADPFRKKKPAAGLRSRKGLFLGKSDVLNKGFDRMFEVAQVFPEGVDFHVVMHNQLPMVREFEKLVEQYTEYPKVRVLSAVHGEAKTKVFESAGCYLHLARWEVFGMGILEAAMHGLPLILSTDCDIAAEAEKAGAAYLMDSYDEAAQQKLKVWLEKTAELEEMGENARNWALANYDSAAIAKQTLEFYEKCLAGSSTPEKHGA